MHHCVSAVLMPTNPGSFVPTAVLTFLLDNFVVFVATAIPMLAFWGLFIHPPSLWVCHSRSLFCACVCGCTYSSSTVVLRR